MKKVLVLFLATSCVSISERNIIDIVLIAGGAIYVATLASNASGRLNGSYYKRVSVPLTYVQDESDNSTNVKINTKNKSSNLDIREGRGCAQSILGIVATGDGSIETAKRHGNIKRAVSVSTEITSVLGFFAQSCTIVSGY